MMLELDPGQRPQLAHVMAHPWLAPHLYRLPTTLGSLPCTSKAARRPLSSVRFNPFESIHLLTSSPRSLENGAKRNPVSSALVFIFHILRKHLLGEVGFSVLTSLKIGRDREHMTFFGISSKFVLNFYYFF